MNFFLASTSNEKQTLNNIGRIVILSRYLFDSDRNFGSVTLNTKSGGSAVGSKKARPLRAGLLWGRSGRIRSSPCLYGACGPKPALERQAWPGPARPFYRPWAFSFPDSISARDWPWPLLHDSVAGTIIRLNAGKNPQNREKSKVPPKNRQNIRGTC